MSWRINLTRSAKKDMRKVPKKDFKHIHAVVESMKVTPFIGDRQKLSGQVNEYRRRIGNWRIFFSMDTSRHMITIMHIRRRNSKTYSK